jgi:metal-responsive CopG/Arc/MetJ family transcriptional regulator
VKKKSTSDGKVKISINIPERLLIELDNYRTQENQDRSIWITSAIMEKLASIKLQKHKE